MPPKNPPVTITEMSDVELRAKATAARAALEPLKAEAEAIDAELERRRAVELLQAKVRVKDTLSSVLAEATLIHTCVSGSDEAPVSFGTTCARCHVLQAVRNLR